MKKYILADSSLMAIAEWPRLPKTLAIGILVLLPLVILSGVIILHNNVVQGEIVNDRLYEKQMELAELVIIMTSMDRQDLELKKRQVLQEMIATAEQETSAVGHEEVMW